MTTCKTDSQWELAGCGRELKSRDKSKPNSKPAQINLKVGDGGRGWEEGSGGREHMYTYR